MTRPGRSSLPNKVNGASTSVLSWFRNVRRDWNEYRLGADLDFFGVKLTLSTSGISTKMAHLHGRAEYDTPALGSECANELRDGPRDFALNELGASRTSATRSPRSRRWWPVTAGAPNLGGQGNRSGSGHSCRKRWSGRRHARRPLQSRNLVAEAVFLLV